MMQGPLVEFVRKTRRGMRWLLAVAFLALGVAHMDASAQSARPAGVTDEQLFGHALRDSKWKDPKIQVCWENPSPADAPYRAIVQRAVAQTWEKVSASIRFLSWQQCTDELTGIRIRIAEEDARVIEIGRFLGGRRGGMVLNFTFERWSPQCAASQPDKEFCVAALAVHEFGHALGFTHEQNRDDAPAQCRIDSQGPVGDYKVTKYDPTSIMNYCNPAWMGDGKLSALDVEAVKKFYP